MKNGKPLSVKMVLAFAILSASLFSFNSFGDDLPKGVEQVWTSIEGNIIYYVKPGDKVKKGDPLFFVLNSDNNPANFICLKHQVDYYNKLYTRRETLIKKHAVSQEDLDSAYQNLKNAEDQLVIYLCLAGQSFYRAPFDCEIVKLLYLQNSGIGDGNPAINIRNIEKDYQFQPVTPKANLVKILDLSRAYLQEKESEIDVKDIHL